MLFKVNVPIPELPPQTVPKIFLQNSRRIFIHRTDYKVYYIVNHLLKMQFQRKNLKIIVYFEEINTTL